VIQVIDSQQGYQGYVAAWYVQNQRSTLANTDTNSNTDTDTKTHPQPIPPAVSRSTPVDGLALANSR